MIYLDHAATTPTLAEVRDAMAVWSGIPANPSSVHGLGQRAAAAVERAREQVAALLGRPSSGIVFTSGATEANHQALRGLAAGARSVAVSQLEHPSVLGAIRASGLELIAVDVDVSGRAAVPEPCADVLCLMAANHETGIVQDLGAADRWMRAGRAVHVDATQAAGKLAPERLASFTTVSVSAHKLGGPMGVGALSLSSGAPFPPLLTGGAQERGRRAGTLNVPGIVGFGVAAEVATHARTNRQARWVPLQQELEVAVVALGGRLAGDAERLASHVCAVFDDVEGEIVVQGLDLRGIAVSSGAACASGSLEPSPVLLAMGDPAPSGGVRITLGPLTTEAEVSACVSALGPVLRAARAAL